MEKKTYFEQRILVSNLKKFKEDNNLSYEEIGNATGMNKTSVYKIFSMINSPSFEFLVNVSKYMKVPISALFTPGEDLLREYYAETINQRLQELNLSLHDLEKKLQIHPLRLNDILKARVTPTKEELSMICDTLDLSQEEVYTFENKNIMLGQLLKDFGLSNDQISSLVDYISTINK